MDPPVERIEKVFDLLNELNEYNEFNCTGGPLCFAGPLCYDEKVPQRLPPPPSLRKLLKDVFLLPGWLTRPDGVLRLPAKLFSCMLITATVRWGLGQRRVIRGMGQMQSVG